MLHTLYPNCITIAEGIFPKKKKKKIALLFR